MTKATSLPIHLHFGAGKLGIGAVLPTLNRERKLIVVQRSRGEDDGFNWGAIAHQPSVKLCNNAGIVIGSDRGLVAGSEPPYEQSFECVWRVNSKAAITCDDRELSSRAPVLLVVGDLSQVAHLLGSATSLSCSLGSGQPALAALLAKFPLSNNKRIPVVGFENTVDPSLQKIERKGWEFFHAVTDRICVDRKLGAKSNQIDVDCEGYLSVVVARECGLIFESRLTSDKEPRPIRLVNGDHVAFHARKKRALVNSLHQILALFCLRALREQGVPSNSQYLSLVRAWLQHGHPHLLHGVEVYKRFRALELVWPLCGSDKSAALDIAAPIKEFYGLSNVQQIYDVLLHEADVAVERFSSVPDELKRLINPNNNQKELDKYYEHVHGPFKWFMRHEAAMQAFPLYDKPNVEDLRALDEELATFLRVAI
jgi:hypothetical protein